MIKHSKALSYLLGLVGLSASFLLSFFGIDTVTQGSTTGLPAIVASRNMLSFGSVILLDMNDVKTTDSTFLLALYLYKIVVI